MRSERRCRQLLNWCKIGVWGSLILRKAHKQRGSGNGLEILYLPGGGGAVVRCIIGVKIGRKLISRHMHKPIADEVTISQLWAYSST